MPKDIGLEPEVRGCINDLLDIITKLLEVIAPGKLYSPFHASLREYLNTDNPIYDIEEFMGHLNARVNAFLDDVEKEKQERKLRFVL